MEAYIKAVEYYLPSNVLTNEDLSRQFPEWTAEKIYSKVGIKSRHVAAEDETALDMAEKAANKLFEANPSLKGLVDYILFCTQSPDYKLPTGACILQNRLGLSTGCGALDFNLGCSGYVYGLSLAKGLICAGLAKNVLFLTAETYTKYIHPKDKGNKSIFGDAATATIISCDGVLKIGAFEFGTDGSGAGDLIVKTGGAKNPDYLNDAGVDEDGHVRSSDNLYMDGASIFSFTIKEVPRLIRRVIENNNLTPENVDYYVLHQANVYILEYLRKKLKIEKGNFAYYIEAVGNTVSNTVPIVLSEGLKDKTLLSRKNILVAGFGVGLSWAGTILSVFNNKIPLCF